MIAFFSPKKKLSEGRILDTGTPTFLFPRLFQLGNWDLATPSSDNRRPATAFSTPPAIFFSTFLRPPRKRPPPLSWLDISVCKIYYHSFPLSIPLGHYTFPTLIAFE